MSPGRRSLPTARRVVLQPGPYRHAFCPEVAPIASAPGETVVVHTADYFGGLLSHEDQVPSAILDDRSLNPGTGPSFVRRAAFPDWFVDTP